jgi:hypothetical protein
MGEDERPPASHCDGGVLLSSSSLLASNSSKSDQVLTTHFTVALDR